MNMRIASMIMKTKKHINPRVRETYLAINNPIVLKINEKDIAEDTLFKTKYLFKVWGFTILEFEIMAATRKGIAKTSCAVIIVYAKTSDFIVRIRIKIVIITPSSLESMVISIDERLPTCFAIFSSFVFYNLYN